MMAGEFPGHPDRNFPRVGFGKVNEILHAVDLGFLLDRQANGRGFEEGQRFEVFGFEGDILLAQAAEG